MNVSKTKIQFLNEHSITEGKELFKTYIAYAKKQLPP